MLRRRLMMGQDGGEDWSTKYLTFTVVERGYFSASNIPNGDFYYSLDNGSTWTALNGGTTRTLDVGTVILWKASGITPSMNYGIGRFAMSGTCDVSGNIMSMCDGDNFQSSTTISNNYQFLGMFRAMSIVSAEHLVLPATTLTQNCYAGLFQLCTSLTTAPALPATTLAQSCYRYMFNKCTPLTAAPELPAATLASGSYYGMFEDCTSLNYIKCLATDISATNCLNNWVNGVAASGTFVKAASMSSWPTGASGIPSGWTVQNA